MKSKSILFLIVVILAFSAFLSGYFVSQKDFRGGFKNSDNRSTSILEKFNVQTVKNGPKSLSLLSDRRALSPTLLKAENKIVYYEKNTGKVFRIDLEGKKEEVISYDPLPNLIRTIWSPTAQEVVSLFYGPGGNRFKYYNYKTHFTSDLGTEIKSLIFSPSGDQIFYFTKEDQVFSFFIAKPDNSLAKKILSTRLEYAEVYWPADDLLAFKAINLDGTYSLYSLSRDGQIKVIIKSKEDLDVRWSQDGARLLLSSREDGLLDLSYLDLTSGEIKSLSTSTSADKCAWDTKISVICGVAKASSSEDEIYRIDIGGTKKLLDSPKMRLAVQGVFITNNYIVTLNSLDNRLYLLKN